MPHNVFWSDFLTGVAEGRTEFFNTQFVENNYQTVKTRFLRALDGAAPTVEHFLTLEFEGDAG